MIHNQAEADLLQYCSDARFVKVGQALLKGHWSYGGIITTRGVEEMQYLTLG
jgi:hypothetical protein